MCRNEIICEFLWHIFWVTFLFTPICVLIGPDKTNWTGVVLGVLVVAAVAVLCFISFYQWRPNGCQVNRVCKYIVIVFSYETVTVHYLVWFSSAPSLNHVFHPLCLDCLDMRNLSGEMEYQSNTALQVLLKQLQQQTFILPYKEITVSMISFGQCQAGGLRW